MDASKDVASAAGSIISPFTDATGAIMGGTYNGLKDVVGGVATGIFDYKEKREPQLLGGLLVWPFFSLCSELRLTEILTGRRLRYRRCGWELDQPSGRCRKFHLRGIGRWW